MRATYVTLDEPLDIGAWSGTNRHIALALEAQGVILDYVGLLRDPYRVAKQVRWRIEQTLGRNGYLPDRSHFSARSYARQTARSISAQTDFVFSTGALPIAYLKT